MTDPALKAKVPVDTPIMAEALAKLAEDYRRKAEEAPTAEERHYLFRFSADLLTRAARDLEDAARYAKRARELDEAERIEKARIAKGE